MATKKAKAANGPRHAPRHAGTGGGFDNWQFAGKSETKSRNETRRIRPRRSLRERKIPGRRLMEFPAVKGKTIDKIELLTSAEYHCITLDFHDQTVLNLAIQPGFAIRGELQRREKGERRTLAEWPPIQSSRRR